VGRDDSYRAEISAPGKTSASVWVSERACVFAMYKRVCVYAQDINKKEKKNESPHLPAPAHTHTHTHTHTPDRTCYTGVD